MSRAFVALLLLSATTVSALAQTLPLPSRWTSQNYSYLEFDQMVSRGGEFIGIYVDHDPNFACNNLLTKMSGFVHGADVTFTVQWWLSPLAPAQCGTTTWTGKLSGNTITTRWVRTAKGFPTVSGTATFTRKP